MELLNITEYFFPAITIGIIVITGVIRSMFPVGVHVKWVTLIVALIGGAFQFTLHQINDPAEPFQHWKVINSLGLAVIGYDYFFKVVKDLIQRKDPIKENNPS